MEKVNAIKTIAILNLKGGVGKSTTAKNMAYVLGADYGKKVLLVDLDSSGNLSASMTYMDGAEPKLCKRADRTDDFGMPHLLLHKDASIKDYILHTTFENVDLIPSNDTMQLADSAIRMDTTVPQQYRIQRHLQRVAGDYDYCILDCPPAQDMIVVNALYCSQELIIPTTMNQDSLSAVTRVVELVKEISDYNPVLSIRGVLFTMVSPNTRLGKQGVPEMRSIFNGAAFETYIRHSITMEWSRFANQSQRQYKKQSQPALDYDNFVAEYLGLPSPHPEIHYL